MTDEEFYDYLPDENKFEGKKGAIKLICELILDYGPGCNLVELVQILRDNVEVDKKEKKYFTKRTIQRRMADIRRNSPKRYLEFDFKSGKYREVII